MSYCFAGSCNQVPTLCPMKDTNPLETAYLLGTLSRCLRTRVPIPLRVGSPFLGVY